MRKKVLLLALTLTAVLAVGLVLPRVLPVLRTYKALGAFLEENPLSANLSAEVTLGESRYRVSVELDRTESGGKRVTALSYGGRSVYLCDNLLYLENGRSYRLTQASGEKVSVWQGILGLLRYARVEGGNKGCTVTLEGRQAQSLVDQLLPGMEAVVPEVESLALELVTERNSLVQIRFRGSGWLEEKGQTPVSLDISLEMVTPGRSVSIPGKVTDAIEPGDASSARPLTENLFRLVSAFLALEEQNPLGGTLTLMADCGPLALDKTLELYSWSLEDRRIYSIQENGSGLYYCNGTLCDGQGRVLPLDSSTNGTAATLPELLLAVCLRLTADCTQMGEQYVYRFSLDAQAMSELACAIAPETEKLPLTWNRGTVKVVVAEDRLQSLEVKITGSLSVILTQVEVSIGGEITLEPGSANVALPPAVEAAMLRP